jgi:phage tail protein X
VPVDTPNLGLVPQQAPSLGAGSEAAPGYSSSVVVEELDAPDGRQKRSVTLIGPSLPFMGANWGGRNSMKTTWYPGNGDEATQQRMGPAEIPSHWSGEWNRTRFGRQPAKAVLDDGSPLTIVDPETLCELLEDLFRAEMRLRVTWSVSGDSPSARLKKVREGQASTWDFKYTRAQDIEWSVQWEWQSRGARTQTVTNVRDGSLDAAIAASNLAAANLKSRLIADTFNQSRDRILHSATPLTLGQLETLANAPTLLANSVARSVQQIQSQLEQVGAIASTLASQPASVANSAINVAKNAVSAANQFVDVMGQKPVELESVKANARDLMRAARYFGQVSDAATLASRRAQELVDRMRAKAPIPSGAASQGPSTTSATEGDMLAVYVTRDGDTPQRLSQRYYGSPDHAIDIMTANRLPWYQPSFPKGTALFIPKLKTAQRGA